MPPISFHGVPNHAKPRIMNLILSRIPEFCDICITLFEYAHLRHRFQTGTEASSTMLGSKTNALYQEDSFNTGYFISPHRQVTNS